METLFSVEYDLRGLDLGLLEFWLFEDDLSKHEGKTANQVSDDLLFPKTYQSTPAARGEVACKLLEDLEQIPIEEELNNWYEEKIDLSIFDTFDTGMDLDLDSEHGQGGNSAPPELVKTATDENTAMNVREEAFPQKIVKREITAVDVLEEPPQEGIELETEALNVKEESLPLDTQRLMLEIEHAIETADKNNACETRPQGTSSEGVTSAPAVVCLMQTSDVGKDGSLVKIGGFIGNTAGHVHETREVEVNEFARKEAGSIFSPVEGGFIESEQPEQILPDLEPVCTVTVGKSNSSVCTDNSSRSSFDSSCSVIASVSDTTGYYAIPSPSSSSQSVPSPCSSSSSSVFEALSPDLSLTCNDSDLEWLPTNEIGTSQLHEKPHSHQSQTKSATPKKQTRGQNNNADLIARRLRKKEQNKTAATRYRLKKKLEFEEINKVVEEQTKRNKELRQKAYNIAHEIKYLKGLMREVFKAKCNLKVPSFST